MSVISIETALKHLRADDDSKEMVQIYLDAAEEQAAEYLNRRFFADETTLADAVLDGSAGADPMLINNSITAACLLTMGHLYEHREDVIIGTITAQLPIGSRSLLLPYRVGMGI